MSFGVIVSSRTAPPPVRGATRGGTAHVALPAASGPVDKAYKINTLDDFVTLFGARTGATVPSYDWLDCFFREGGRQAYVARYTTTAYQAALTLLADPANGPGQLAVVGITPSSGLFTDMQSHCSANNRWAVRDVNLNDSVAAMATVGGLAPASDDLGATFGPWVTIPAPAGVIGGTSRSVPASAFICAKANLVELDGNPGRAVSGQDYPASYATDVTVHGILDSDRVTLFTSGVNTIAVVNNVLQGDGFQSNIAQSSAAITPYWQAQASRLRMFIKDRAKIRALPYQFRPIDGRGDLANALKGDIDEEMLALFNANAFGGDTQVDSFSVTVSSAINTTTTIANGELHAVAEYIPAMHAKAVFVDLVTVPVGGSL